MKKVFNFEDVAKLIEVGIIINNGYDIDWENYGYSGDLYDYADMALYIYAVWKNGRRAELFSNDFCYDSITEFMNTRPNIESLIKEYFEI